MHSTLLFTTFFAASIASPLAHHKLAKRDSNPTWTPAPDSTTTCNTTSDKIIGLDIDSRLEAVLNDACAAMMAPCAYQELLPPQTICIQTTDWPLQGPVNSTQPANVLSSEGEKLTGWDVQFTVTPAQQPADAPPVFWTRQECYGYFAQMLEKQAPAGCQAEQGIYVGKVTAGGNTALKGTVFELAIVPEAVPEEILQ